MYIHLTSISCLSPSASACNNDYQYHAIAIAHRNLADAQVKRRPEDLGSLSSIGGAGEEEKWEGGERTNCEAKREG